jgi:hypothetical protein
LILPSELNAGERLSYGSSILTAKTIDPRHISWMVAYASNPVWKIQRKENVSPCRK